MGNEEKRGLSEKSLSILKKMQGNEQTEHLIYAGIAKRVKDEHNRSILEKIAADEKKHAEVWEAYTQTPGKAKRSRVWWYLLLNRIFGFTFTVKQMEKGEGNAEKTYQALEEEVPEARRISEDEDRHEAQLLELLDEERLRYVGSMVLGLNDALVELTGTLAGLTFALQNNRLIALSGLITGISATFSMASSEFLSARSEGKPDALKSCLYTGVAYLITVAMLTFPYLILGEGQYLLSLIGMLCAAVLIIFLFTYYISVAQGLNFKRRFGEMALVSLSVAALSFVVGLLVKQFLGIDL